MTEVLASVVAVMLVFGLIAVARRLDRPVVAPAHLGRAGVVQPGDRPSLRDGEAAAKSRTRAMSIGDADDQRAAHRVGRAGGGPAVMAREHHSVSDERPQQRRLGLGNGLIVDAVIIAATIALLARELVRPSNWRSPPDADRTLH